MTMLMQQFHSGSQRRKNKMLAKILVAAIAVVAVSCENHIYRLKTAAPQAYQNIQKELKEYQSHEHIPLRQYHEAPASEEQYKSPESHGQGHAYSSQSIIHHGQAASYEESSEANTEHVAPVYQYVDENNEEQNSPHAVPKHKYTEVHYPAPAPVHQEYQTIQVPYHKLQSHYQPESHYQQESHEGLSYHHEVPHNAPQHIPHPHHEVPVHHAQESHESHDEPIDYYAYPKYQYEYKVEDPHTGDNKFQHEMRDGDVVKGAYGLHEADGSIRTVEYSSDKHNGFTAIVKHSAPGQHMHIESHHKN